MPTGQAMKPVRRVYGGKLVNDFGSLALKNVRQWVIDQAFARTYIHHQINLIRLIFKWVPENQLVSVEEYHELKPVAGLTRNRSSARESESVTSHGASR